MEVKLHDIGEGMTEGEILHYFVKEGDFVKMDAPLLEVQTDKVTAEITAPVQGTVERIYVETGTTATVGTVLLSIQTTVQGQTEETVPIKHKETFEPVVASASIAQTSTKQAVTALPLATPYTRKLARERGIRLEEIVPTGVGGRILDGDVLQHTENRTVPSENSTSPENEVKEAKRIPIRGRRKQIATKMTQAAQAIPHVTHFEEIDLTRLLALRAETKEATGVSYSLAAYFVKAIEKALGNFPVFNGAFQPPYEEVVVADAVHIGLATDTEEGLIVPVIRHVQRKNIATIDKEMKEVNTAARENRLTSQQLGGSTFTMSNVGPLGSTGATPILNAPETGLLAFHKTKERPVVRNGEIVIGQVMNVSMSFDHRVVDGGTAVAFTNKVKRYLEFPILLCSELM